MMHPVAFVFALVLALTIWYGPVGATMATDSGQYRCYNTKEAIDCPPPGNAFYGQDGNVSHVPAPYEAHGDIVRDPVTGLSWQRSPDLARRSFDDARSYCSGLTLEGENGWRVPSLHELFTLIDYGRKKPSLDPIFFTTENPVWSADTFPGNDALGYIVSFEDGGVFQTRTHFFMNVRCVRGAVLPYGPYTDRGRFVLDESTGLSWLQADEAPATWKDALRFCQVLEDGGNNDWRLPNARELSSLLDPSRTPIAANTRFSAHPEAYWTSTTDIQTPTNAWVMQYDTATSHTVVKTEARRFRCVRTDQAIAVPHDLLLMF
ncbi:DUF1566 domain-containing protein [Desulfovibrio inopinatus]|uniref:Lcl C-terminal domain-containing protein n=1 Tax=Desulfovibrio inopinatus TaxID=102109 RepID=UPI000412F48F|nr:DUF1566 domain-containing protein [Desulfovibrio inopinatus]